MEPSLERPGREKGRCGSPPPDAHEEASPIWIALNDPRKLYFRFLYGISIALPDTAEKILDDLLNSMKGAEIPEVTRRLMLESVNRAEHRLRRIEEKLRN
jgi:SpoVK/Ycf46/Vps4 family AAA+-type ATPase